jgi:hypothetical protein
VLDHAAAIRSTPRSFPLSSDDSCDAGRALAHGATQSPQAPLPTAGQSTISTHTWLCHLHLISCEDLRDSKRIHPCLSCDCVSNLFGIATVDNQISSGSILLIRELAVGFASHAQFISCKDLAFRLNFLLPNSDPNSIKDPNKWPPCTPVLPR